VAKKKKKTSALTEGHKVVARNKKAQRDYDISERLEAGVVLLGSEVKSLRDSKVTLTDGYVEFKSGEAWLSGIQINEYPWANRFNHEPGRTRKLLLHKEQIRKLEAKVAQKGFTVVPLAVYFKGGKVKVEIGVGRGRREYEKRHVKKEQMAKREMDQAIKRRR
jgi:SsrA-binding protein